MGMLMSQGCARELLTTRIDAAEKQLSQGKAPEENLKEMNPLLPPSLVVRHKIALIVESILKGDFSYSAVKAELADIRNSSLTPGYLSVEAGYLLALIERMEVLSRTAGKAKECTKDNEELKRNLEQLRKENEDLKKGIEDLNFKLKKLEEIHIESVKRRGNQ